MERMLAAAERDAGADARDVAAIMRDKAAELRDGVLAARDGERPEEPVAARTGLEIVLRAAEDRARAAADRAAAARAHARAADDRRHAAADRRSAAQDRMAARADREALLAELALAETDPLTGARSRRAGLADLDREIERAQRTTGLLSVAYVDVVGLKAVNDSQGHAAGDALLVRVVAVIRAHLRSYDLVVRIGGDEFLCAMSNMPLRETRARFARAAAELRTPSGARGIRTGFADITPGESAPELIARADRALIDRRSR
jgi:diguanylate cyclase (GGDEF)-like protein